VRKSINRRNQHLRRTNIAVRIAAKSPVASRILLVVKLRAKIRQRNLQFSTAVNVHIHHDVCRRTKLTNEYSHLLAATPTWLSAASTF